MRTAVWLATVLVVLGWILSEVPLARTSLEEPASAAWRRTNDGWQRPSDWTTPPEIRHPNLHPLVVGTLELLASLAALVAFPSGSHARRAGAPQAIVAHMQS